MTKLIESVEEIFESFDVAVLDQWGVLHQGTSAYPGASGAVDAIAKSSRKVVILSNSGRRADENLKRIVAFGFSSFSIHKVMSSGEAVWNDLALGNISSCGRHPRMLYPICATDGDAERWAGDGCFLRIVHDLDAADALLLMGVPERTRADAYDGIFAEAQAKGLGMICSNPDRISPRSYGLITSPGTLAHRFQQAGGSVTWYGKPYSRVFDLVAESHPGVNRERIVMIGDSIEHDISGGNCAGFATVFVRGGIHSDKFGDDKSDADILEGIGELAEIHGNVWPDYSLPFLTSCRPLLGE